MPLNGVARLGNEVRPLPAKDGPGMPHDFWTYLLVGFAAQIVDGSIGMAYGVVSTSVLLAAGVAPAQASAAVHIAKIFAGTASGLSHLWLGNVDWPLCRRLLIPGCIGGLVGAALVSYAPVDLIKPLVAAYLLLMGIVLLARAARFRAMPAPSAAVTPLGLVGGLLDSLGGGWGPVVTSTLIARGHAPRQVIGSVNLAEVFVAVAQSAMFAALLGFGYFDIVIGLALGGIVAAPFAALLARYAPARLLIVLVGVAVSAVSLRTLFGIL